MLNKKKFLIIGNKNAITYKNVFIHIKCNELWLGMTPPNEFVLPNGNETKKVNGMCRWFTNIPHNKNQEPLVLTKTYNPIDYPKYDNYDAIEVSKVKDIPIDYDGVMGIPITFLNNYCNSQFEIIGIACGNSWANYTETLKSLNFNPNIKYGGGLGCGIVNGKPCYARILIKKNVDFEIVGMAEDNGKGYSGCANWDGLNTHCVINGKNMFKRIFIKRIKV